MKKALPIILVVAMLLFGIFLLFYPDIASWYHAQLQQGIFEENVTTIAELEAAYIADHFARAEEYNEALNGGRIQDPFVEGSGAVLPPAYYIETLNINGVMAWIEIPRLDINLPVFHTTNYDVLNRGVGHIEATSFPIGGTGTHAVLTGHSGLAHARLFTPLLAERHPTGILIGDMFFIRVLDRTLAYEVVDKIIVLPHEVETLRIDQTADYVTLITCTPYAINSHRLLVRGARVPYEPGMELEIEPVVQSPLDWRTLIVVGFVVLFLLGLLIFKIRETKKRKEREEARLQQLDLEWRRK